LSHFSLDIDPVVNPAFVPILDLCSMPLFVLGLDVKHTCVFKKDLFAVRDLDLPYIHICAPSQIVDIAPRRQYDKVMDLI